MKRTTTMLLVLLYLVFCAGLTVAAQEIQWKPLNDEALSLYHKGLYDRAVVVATNALQIAEQETGSNHLYYVADSLNNLALVYKAQGQYAAAEPLYKRALAIDEKAVGPDHPAVATDLNNLAVLYYSQGQYAAAEPLLRRALAIRDKVLGPDHPDVAANVNNLAALYKAQGQYAAAEPLYKRALAIREKALGQDHPYVAQSLNNLAALYYYEGQ
ncbi:MAG: tetratricopeptide repeat protein, partial [bacterium]|nr:tetratricopeptide repeat protein [bacterium]